LSNENASSTFEKSFYKKSSQVSLSVPDLWLYGIGTMNCPWHCWYHESHRSGHIPFFLWIPISPSHYEQITLSVALRHMGESPIHLSFKFSIFLLRMFSYSSVLKFLVFYSSSSSIISISISGVLLSLWSYPILCICICARGSNSC
jgi:hypothetical protein